MTATAFDPAARASLDQAGTSLELTSAGSTRRVSSSCSGTTAPNGRSPAYDIVRRNVYVQFTNAVATLAGEIDTQGVELAAACGVRRLEFWGQRRPDAHTLQDSDVFTATRIERRAPHRQRRGVLSLEQLGLPVESAARCAMSAAVSCSRTTPPAMEPFRRRTCCVRGHPRQGFGCRHQHHAHHVPRAQCDRRGLRRLSDPATRTRSISGAAHYEVAARSGGSREPMMRPFGAAASLARHPARGAVRDVVRQRLVSISCHTRR